LYVGKATSLRARVSQYFSGQEEKSRGYRMQLLIRDTVRIETQETDTVLEALILEAELIKQFQPKYNIDGKDDKSYCYFVVTKEEFPRVVIVRETDFVKKKYQDKVYTRGKKFGPYTSKEQMQVALKIIRRIFPFHVRSEASEKGCLDAQIGLCPGPHDGRISLADYKGNMRNISLFLTGHKKKILIALEREMNVRAKEEDFERAAVLKKQIYALTHINDIALMSRRDHSLPLLDGDHNQVRLEAFDISHISGDHMVASMVVFVNGLPRKSAYRKFKIKAVQGINDVAAMREVIARRLGHLHDWGVPTVMILDGGQGHLNMGEKLFSDMDVPQSIGLLAVAKGPTRKKVDVYESQQYPVSSEIVSDLHTIEALREEAHRFAITYHKSLRRKGFK
jgi:excinuclease ABC subunit C